MSNPAIGKHGQLAQGGDNSLDALLAVAVGHQARVLVVLLQDALAQNTARSRKGIKQMHCIFFNTPEGLNHESKKIVSLLQSVILPSVSNPD